jgi:SRF-type transcription factor (DNA-binding and dimerisation domain).
LAVKVVSGFPSIQARVKTSLCNTQMRPTISKKGSQVPSATRKKMRQKRSRRTNTLIKKAYELSCSCDADVFFGVRIKNSGHIYTFCADSTGIWSSISSQLVLYIVLFLQSDIEAHYQSEVILSNPRPEDARGFCDKTKKHSQVSLRQRSR